MNVSSGPTADAPAGVMTATGTVPDPDGTTAMIRVPDSLTRYWGLDLLPKHTISARVKPVPLMVTWEPPAPACGATEVTEAASGLAESDGVASGPVGAAGPTLVGALSHAKPPEARATASAA